MEEIIDEEQRSRADRELKDRYGFSGQVNFQALLAEAPRWNRLGIVIREGPYAELSNPLGFGLFNELVAIGRFKDGESWSQFAEVTREYSDKELVSMAAMGSLRCE